MPAGEQGVGAFPPGGPAGGRRICGSRHWKLIRAKRHGAAPSPTGRTVSGPLFDGTVYLANLAFQVGGRSVAITPSDLATVRQYLTKIVTPVTSYAAQYGPCGLRAGTILPEFATPAISGSYSDADLQAWVDAMVASNQLGVGSALIVLNPPPVVNRDAKETGGVGVLGYHGAASRPYCFVNTLGTGFALDDRSDLFAEAVSHELAEMTVDPRADDSNPEVCDGCGTNCQGTSAYRAFFDGAGSYLATSTRFPPPFAYAFFLSAVARPGAAADCPAPASACDYAPP